MQIKEIDLTKIKLNTRCMIGKFEKGPVNKINISNITSSEFSNTLRIIHKGIIMRLRNDIL